MDIGRGGGIRTRDPLLPKQMRYQAARYAPKGGNYTRYGGARTARRRGDSASPDGQRRPSTDCPWPCRSASTRRPRHAAVDRQVRARDERGVRSQQEHDGRRDLVGIGASRQRRGIPVAFVESRARPASCTALGCMIIGVSTRPGHTVFTRMPRPPAPARRRASVRAAPFAGRVGRAEIAGQAGGGRGIDDGRAGRHRRRARGSPGTARPG